MLKILIQGQELDLKSDEQIALTYSNLNVDTPTAEKNTFSKSIEVNGTPKNNKIFGDIWKLDRNIVEGNGIGVNFDSRKRVECSIYNNADIVEDGYIQLNEISVLGGEITYRITFYGGIGDFFYNLMYNENGKMSLADLHYGFKDNNGNEFKDEDKDLIIMWDKKYLKESWNTIKTADWNDKRISNIVVPAPVYGGYYDDFESTKILIDTNGLNGLNTNYFPTMITDGGKSYRPYNNRWSLVEVSRDMDEWEVRNLNTLNQRPAIRLSTILNAISDPKNNGGYKVLWDEDINDYTKDLGVYYQKSFILMDKMDFDIEDTTNIGTIKVDMTPNILSATHSITHDGQLIFNTNDMVTPKISLMVQGQVNFPLFSMGQNGWYPTEIYGNGAVKNRYPYYNFPCYRIIVKQNGTIYYKSPIYALSSYYDSSYLNDSSGNKFIYEAFGESGTAFNGTTQIIYKDIKFDKYATSMIGNTEYITYSHDGVKIEADLPKGSNVTIDVEIHNVGFYVEGRTAVKTSYPLWNISNANGVIEQRVSTSINYGLDKDGELATNYVYEGNVAPSIQKTYVSKKILFGNTATPFEYLTGFTKMLGMKFLYESKEKVVKIIKRNDYYYNSVTDMRGRVDYSQMVRIQPCLSEYKWYKWGLETPETYASYLYGMKNNTDYGTLLFDTGYEFNNEVNDMYKDNVYTNIIPYRHNSVYFNNVPTLSSVAYTKTYTYTLWNEGEELEKVRYGYGANNLLKKVYDNMPKLCCFTKDNSGADIRNALCFFDGFENTEAIVNDNLQAMYDIVENPCYIYGANKGASEYDIINEIPRFTKCLTKDGAYAHSLDFVRPSQTFADDADRYGEGIGLMKFWKGYIDDMFDINSKIVQLYAILDREPKEALRRFYYFDNSIWSLIEVEDFKPRYQKPLRCTFVKVKDVYNYTTNPSMDERDVIEGEFNVENIDYPPTIDPNEPSFVMSYDVVLRDKHGNEIKRFTESKEIEVGINTTGQDRLIEGNLNIKGVEVGYDVIQEGKVTPKPKNNEIWYTSSTGAVVKTTSPLGKSNLDAMGLVYNIYEDGIGKMVFNKDITNIGDYVFYSTSLTTINIPESVTSIGDNAFNGCTSLTTINIPESVTSIGDFAFYNCRNLTSINIPDGVTHISTYAFSSCRSLTKVNSDVDGVCNIPESVTSIGTYAFSTCESLTTINIPDGVTSIGNEVFWQCRSLVNIIIPDSVTSIGSSAFSSCESLTTINIPNGVTIINDGAFAYCHKLAIIAYDGTVAQWRKIDKRSDWKKEIQSTCIVHCTDGDIPITNA